MARGAKRHALPRPGWLRLVGVVCGNKAGDVDEGLRGGRVPGQRMGSHVELLVDAIARQVRSISHPAGKASPGTKKPAGPTRYIWQRLPAAHC